MFSYVSSPISTGVVMKRNTPSIVNRNESVIISNCEPYFTVTSGPTPAFVNTSGAIIPSQVLWLNGIAVNYSRWRWLKFDLFYVPSVSTSTTGEQAGGFQYDRGDLAPATFAQLQQFTHSVTSPVWAGATSSAAFNGQALPGSVHMSLDVAKFNGIFYRYILAASLATLNTTDQNVYVPATFVGGNQGNTNVNTLMGRWYAKYVVELIEPITPGLNT